MGWTFVYEDLRPLYRESRRLAARRGLYRQTVLRVRALGVGALPRATRPAGRDARMRLEELDLEIPAELIAQHPLQPRDACRLLVVDRRTGVSSTERFRTCRTCFARVTCWFSTIPGSLPARLCAQKATGGRVELLFLRPATPDGCEPASDRRATESGRCSPGHRGRLRAGRRADAARGRGAAPGRLGWGRAAGSVAGEDGHRFVARSWSATGSMPLPPYIKTPLEPTRRLSDGVRRSARARRRHPRRACTSRTSCSSALSAGGHRDGAGHPARGPRHVPAHHRGDASRTTPSTAKPTSVPPESRRPSRCRPRRGPAPGGGGDDGRRACSRRSTRDAEPGERPRGAALAGCDRRSSSRRATASGRSTRW